MMLSFFCSACAVIAAGVARLTSVLRQLVLLNYELVAAVVNHVTYIFWSAVSVYDHCKQATVTFVSFIAEYTQELCMFMIAVVSAVCNLVSSVCRLLQFIYANVCNLCLFFAEFVSAFFQIAGAAAIAVCGNLKVYALSIASLTIMAISSVCGFFMSLASWSVYFVTGVWSGLGYVLSSFASLPTFLSQNIRNVFVKFLQLLTDIITFTTKETYLGIVIMCLTYLMLSNTLRYLYSQGLSLFPHRIRRRRTRANLAHWQVDRGFESDFEDLFNSETEDVSWNAPEQPGDDNTHDSEENSESDTNDHEESDRSGNESDADESESEEYTVVTEESDSDASINSQTFSTGSSDHDIEVQLPPVDKQYGMWSRSSTPSTFPRSLSSPEEFDREIERERDKRKCVICQDQVKSVLVLPCKHLCMCILCADQIVRSRMIGRRVCPLCRTKISKVMNIYV